jgi:hypothetical protein
MRIARAITKKQNRNPDHPDRLGAYYDSADSTPTATRTEGLCAAYRLARDFDRSGDAQDLLEAIRLGIAFQLKTQFRPESVMYLEKPMLALGGFRESLTDYDVRIDFVQHNLSAILGYYRILGGS